MSHAMFKFAFVLAAASLVQCQHATSPALTSAPQATPAGGQATGPSDSSSGISADVRDALASMARAHGQKKELSFYESLPWMKTPEPYHDFYSNMGKVQADLLGELQSWAKGHSVDLSFHFTNDSAGEAQKILEARQEKLVRGDGKSDFIRDTLMQMYDDYEWQISLIQAIQPKVHDPALQAYLAKSLKVHEDGSAQLQGLLKRFKGG